MKVISSAAISIAVLALGACALPPPSQTAKAAAQKSYEDPDTGSMFGGGDSRAENANMDPGLTSQPTGVAAPGGHP